VILQNMLVRQPLPTQSLQNLAETRVVYSSLTLLAMVGHSYVLRTERQSQASRRGRPVMLAVVSPKLPSAARNKRSKGKGASGRSLDALAKHKVRRGKPDAACLAPTVPSRRWEARWVLCAESDLSSLDWIPNSSISASCSHPSQGLRDKADHLVVPRRYCLCVNGRTRTTALAENS